MPANNLGISVTKRAPQWFFDRKIVIDAIGRANAMGLSKAGAFVRQRARTSIRRRKSISEPGQPPHAHAKGNTFASIKAIFFAFEPRRASVVIGPVGLGNRKTIFGSYSAGAVPNLLEFGGTALRRRPVRKFSGRKATPLQRKAFKALLATGQIQRKPVVMQSYTANYRPRPFMGPALKAESPNFPSFWKSSLRAG